MVEVFDYCQAAEILKGQMQLIIDDEVDELRHQIHVRILLDEMDVNECLLSVIQYLVDIL